MSALRIVLADLQYSNDFTYDFLPINLGYIASYANSNFGSEINITLHRDRDKFLQEINDIKPHLFGLSLYYWNEDLVKATIKRLRAHFSSDVIIVVGGPSIDSDTAEQKKMFKKLDGVDALIPGEGEIGFSNLIEYVLHGKDSLLEPLDGVIVYNEGSLITGSDVSKSVDLTKLPSPYLTGLLDDFISPEFSPMMQFSRGCPYMCTYCSSGKYREKMRAFPVEQVKEEILYIAQKYQKYYHLHLLITDENLGLFPSDIEIVDYLCKVSKQYGYPKSMSVYNNKKLSDNAKCVIEKLRHLNFTGFTLPLQSCNEKTLSAVRRKNLTEEEWSSALKWAAEKKLKVYSDVIFGLPYETKTTILSALEEMTSKGFDQINCYNLMLLEGTELNREESREQYAFKTKYRLQGTSYGYFDGIFTAETEEIVTGSSSFSFDDYMDVRETSFMFYSIYLIGFYRWFFNGLNFLGVSKVEFFESFLCPDTSGTWPEGYLKFLEDLRSHFNDELYDNKDELKKDLEEQYKQNNYKVITPTRLNTWFGARLMYMEGDWVKITFERVLIKLLSGNQKK